MAEADSAMAEADSAMAKVDAMMADAYQPSAVMVSAEMLDPSMANLDHVQVSLAGPDSIYVSNIMYGGQPFSALLKYTGGTSATVEAVYGPMGKLLPDSVGLSQTGLAFVAPASLAVSNVEVGGVGYSGTLEYAGGNQLQVTGIRQVTLPPTAAEEAQAAAAAAVAQAEADAAAAVSAAQAAADAAMADKAAAMADAEAAHAAADAAMADADAAMAATSAAEAEAMAAQAEVDAMMADAYQPSAVMVSAEMLDPSMANLDHVQVSLAGPNSIYVSNIMYGGQPFSALLKYTAAPAPRWRRSTDRWASCSPIPSGCRRPAGLRGAGFPRCLQRRGGRGRLLRHPGVRRWQPVAGHRYPPSHAAADRRGDRTNGSESRAGGECIAKGDER